MRVCAVSWYLIRPCSLFMSRRFALFFKRETVEELVQGEAGTRRSGKKGKIGQNVMYERRVKV